MNPSLVSIKVSPTLAMNTLTKEKRERGEKVYAFGFGQSPFQPPEHLIRAIAEGAEQTQYSHTQGINLLRENVARFHNTANGIDCKPEDVFIAPGSKILLDTIMRAFDKADVFVAAPAWVTYIPQVQLNQHNLITIPTINENRWRVLPEILEQVAKQKKHKDSILIINYPGNPDGGNYTADEMTALLQVIRKHEMLVIADEIYSLLSFEVDQASFSNFYPEGTIVTTGLSKWCGAGGWRLGVALPGKGLDPKLIRVMRGIASETYSCASLPIQHAATLAYSSYADVKPFLQAQTKILSQIASYCLSELQEVGIKLHPSSGGFYLFPSFELFKDQLAKKGIFDAASLCKHLLDTIGVALLPGTAFGMAPEHLVARLAYVNFEHPRNFPDFDLDKDAALLLDGIQLLKQYFAEIL